MSDIPYVSAYLGSNTLRIFRSAVREIGVPKYVRFRVHDSGKSMIMERYDKKTQRSFRVPKDLMENDRSMRVHSKSFCYALAQAQNWDVHKSYRIPGAVLIPGKIVVFDLTSAEEISDPYAPGND